MNRVAGYLQGNIEQHLDHLAPLCSLMGWPLIVTDESIYALSKAYYPGLKLHLWNVLEAPFLITQQYDTVITTLPRISFDESFFIAEATLTKRLKTVWLPHGNSDKGHVFPMIEALKDEEAAFVYGPKMIDFLNTKNVKIPRTIPVGNFRYVYFQKHRSFYEKILDEMGLEKNFTLYAPTWKDAENSSSFESFIDEVIEKLSDAPLVIKPHPNELEDIGVIQRQLSSKVKWLDHFPPIYPLLSRTSHLIGDFSSIGYDFLQFNRPMTFFNPTNRKADDPGLFLHHCREEDRPALARYTFGEESTWIPLLEKVKQLDI